MWCRCAGGDEDLDDGKTGVDGNGVNLPLTLADVTGESQQGKLLSAPKVSCRVGGRGIFSAIET